MIQPEKFAPLLDCCVRTAGPALFATVSQCLARTLGIRYVFIAERTLLPGGNSQLTTLARCVDLQPQHNLSYPLPYRPKANEWRRDSDADAGRLVHLFPQDQVPVRLGLSSYRGIPLLGTGDRLVGLLALMHSAPIPTDPALAETLVMLGQRLAGEMMNLNHHRASQRELTELRTMVDGSQILLGLLDDQGRLLRCNHQVQLLFGKSNNQLLGRPIWGKPFTSGDPALEAHLKEALRLAQSGTRVRQVLSYQPEDNDPLTFQFSLLPVRDAAGAVARLVVEAHEFSAASTGPEDRQRDVQLLEECQALTKIISWEWDVEADRLHWPQSGRSWLQLGTQGRPATWEELAAPCTPAARKQLEQALQDALHQGVHWDLELQWQREEGGYRWVRMLGCPRHQHKRVSHIYGVIEDIDTSKRTALNRQSRLERMEQEQELLAQLAHPSANQNAPSAEPYCRLLCRQAARLLKAERVSCWLFTSQKTVLGNVGTWVESQGLWQQGESLLDHHFASLFTYLAHHPYLDANHAATDPRTREYASHYLQPHDISAMLAVALRHQGQPLGMLAIEHVGEPHDWQDDEIRFARHLAELLAPVLAREGPPTSDPRP